MENIILYNNLSIKNILEYSFQIFKKIFNYLIFLYFIIIFPLDLLFPYENKESVNFFRFLIPRIRDILIGVIFQIIVVLLVNQYIDNKKISLKNIFKESLKKIFPVFVTYINLFLIIFALTLLLVIPAIIYKFYFIFVVQAVIIHNISGFEAMKYSQNLVRNRWLKTMFYSLSFDTFKIFLLLVNTLLLTFLFFSLKIPVVKSKFFYLLISFNANLIFSYFNIVYTIFFLNYEKSKQIEASLKMGKPTSVNKNFTPINSI